MRQRSTVKQIFYMFFCFALVLFLTNKKNNQFYKNLSSIEFDSSFHDFHSVLCMFTNFKASFYTSFHNDFIRKKSIHIVVCPYISYSFNTYPAFSFILLQRLLHVWCKVLVESRFKIQAVAFWRSVAHRRESA